MFSLLLYPAGAMANLKGLSLSGNPLEFPAKSVVDSGTDAVLRYLREALLSKAQGKAPLSGTRWPFGLYASLRYFLSLEYFVTKNPYGKDAFVFQLENLDFGISTEFLVNIGLELLIN